MRTSTWDLIDEAVEPPLRARIGRLLAAAHQADFALAHVRLAVLNLQEAELTRLARCRVLLGHLDASMLLDAAESGFRSAAPPLGPVLRLIERGGLEVRSAGLMAWSPDFGVIGGPGTHTALLGSIRFGNPELVTGPAFTIITREPGATRLLRDRFDAVWERSHDVLPAIRQVLERAHGMGNSAGGGGRPLDPGPALR